ncbi:DNA double-strand break repair nuclease NurA [Hymenobacter sp. BT662]|uniref:DNA double-strand break repair nuclease NurA n=2 Tax=Hymenobacter ruricola TaxID=2791023 RepID=A0ABS0I6B2_9BACT|nr:DNA double-strand break repair nuclease NurA [Hymenobacter ruricola]
MEGASKTSHRHVIQDETVKDYLNKVAPRVKPGDIDMSQHTLVDYHECLENPVKSFMAFDGGYQEIVVEPGHPSAALCFFQFGALYFRRDDLYTLKTTPFIDPDDMARLRQMERLKLVLPLRNYVLAAETSITHSIRRTLQLFFAAPREGDAKTMLDTLHWFVFRQYMPVAQQHSTYTLSQCPHCQERVDLVASQLHPTTFAMPCPLCGEELLLIDVLRLHEAIDDELGAGQIMGYVTTAVEQLVLVHFIRIILTNSPSLLKEIFFFKDGPLGFFGQTANMHKPMLDLVSFVQTQHHSLFLVGLEKSGAFVEHAKEISGLLKPGQVLLLDNDYIYKYVTPGKANNTQPYAYTSYYGQKLIFKTPEEAVYVVTVPVPALAIKPVASSIKDLQILLTNVAKLRCDMYDNAIMPIALANKLVSLSNRPSAGILQKFAQARATK